MRRDKLERGLVDKVGMTVCIYVHLNNVAAKEGRKKRWFYGPSSVSTGIVTVMRDAVPLG